MTDAQRYDQTDKFNDHFYERYLNAVNDRNMTDRLRDPNWSENIEIVKKKSD